MIGFYHWLLPFSQLRPTGWLFPEFCKDVFIHLWKRQFRPLSTYMTRKFREEIYIESHAAEYQKFANLINLCDTKVTFFILDAIEKTHPGGGISQLGLSIWTPKQSSGILTLQWNIHDTSFETANCPSSITSDNVHVDQEYDIVESDTGKLLQRQLLHYTSRNHMVVVVSYHIKDTLAKLASHFTPPVDVPLLETRKIWYHKHQDQECETLGDCVQELHLECSHSQQLSAGSNTYHIAHILKSYWQTD